MTPESEHFLRRAIELAAESRAAGNPPFGSLLVAPDGTIVAEAHNTTITDNDISLHPELKLAVWAAANLPRETAANTTMYTSCQPCQMCAGALARSGLGNVIYALTPDLLGSTPFPAVPLDGPHLTEEAQAPVAGYYTS
ncbi:nucleoside deaminase [Kribbella sandramycini]|uniref:Nucleoside deaminase n=1 Tax=Kribbella sandramycini TaxID=60450 RepID=A0A7Y4P0B2_9ACTN|nr:nucleoside deaminase [Kribbella sandramycini]MBB6565450.1 tRNA(Arg) A34 adenosine deaminase TadA [Kribbella sandramycini]NOL41718.1 nucleoside deaminase [Kribbella sandramycini]